MAETTEEKEVYTPDWNRIGPAALAGSADLLNRYGVKDKDTQRAVTNAVGQICAGLQDGSLQMKAGSVNVEDNEINREAIGIINQFVAADLRLSKSRTKKSSSGSSSTASEGEEWKTSMPARLLMSRIAGNTPIESIDDKWWNVNWHTLDDIDQASGKRGTTHRRAVLAAVAKEYRDLLNSGKYKIGDQDLKNQLAIIDDALNGSLTDAAARRNYSKLFGMDWLLNDDATLAISDEAKKKLAADDIKARIKAGEHIHDDGTPWTEEEEKAWKTKLEDEAFRKELNNLSSDVTEQTVSLPWTTLYDDSNPEQHELLIDLENKYNLVKGKGLYGNLLELVLNNPVTIDADGLAASHSPSGDYHVIPSSAGDLLTSDYWKQLGKGVGKDAATGALNGVTYGLGTDALEALDNSGFMVYSGSEGDNKEKIDDSISEKYYNTKHGITTNGVIGGGNYRTLLDYISSQLNDYLYNVVSNPNNAQQLRVGEEGSGNFYVKDSIDWRTRTAKIYHADRKAGTLSRIPILKLLEEIAKANNTQLYDAILLDYKKFKASVTKGLEGIKLEQPKDTSFAEGLAERQAMGEAAYNHKLLNERTLFTTRDWARLAPLALDIIGTATAFAPGAGTGVSLATGVGSTLATLGLDLTDPSVTTGEALSGLAINAGMDVLGVIPGLKASKIVKGIIKSAPLVLTALTMYGAGPGAFSAVKKMTSGLASQVTVGEWKDLAMSMSALLGVARNHGILKKLQKQASSGEIEKTTFFENVTDKDGKVHLLSLEDVNAINAAGEAGGNAAALAKINSILPEGSVADKLPKGVNYDDWNIRLSPLKAGVEFKDGKGNPVTLTAELAKAVADAGKRGNLAALALLNTYMADDAKMSALPAGTTYERNLHGKHELKASQKKITREVTPDALEAEKAKAQASSEWHKTDPRYGFWDNFLRSTFKSDYEILKAIEHGFVIPNIFNGGREGWFLWGLRPTQTVRTNEKPATEPLAQNTLQAQLPAALPQLPAPALGTTQPAALPTPAGSTNPAPATPTPAGGTQTFSTKVAKEAVADVVKSAKSDYELAKNLNGIFNSLLKEADVRALRKLKNDSAIIDKLADLGLHFEGTTSLTANQRKMILRIRELVNNGATSYIPAAIGRSNLSNRSLGRIENAVHNGNMEELTRLVQLLRLRNGGHILKAAGGFHLDYKPFNTNPVLGAVLPGALFDSTTPAAKTLSELRLKWGIQSPKLYDTRSGLQTAVDNFHTSAMKGISPEIDPGTLSVESIMNSEKEPWTPGNSFSNIPVKGTKDPTLSLNLARNTTDFIRALTTNAKNLKSFQKTKPLQLQAAQAPLPKIYDNNLTNTLNLLVANNNLTIASLTKLGVNPTNGLVALLSANDKSNSVALLIAGKLNILQAGFRKELDTAIAKNDEARINALNTNNKALLENENLKAAAERQYNITNNESIRKFNNDQADLALKVWKSGITDSVRNAEYELDNNTKWGIDYNKQVRDLKARLDLETDVAKQRELKTQIASLNALRNLKLRDIGTYIVNNGVIDPALMRLLVYNNVDAPDHLVLSSK